MAKHTAYIGLGSNLGDREPTLRLALEMLNEGADVCVRRVSPFYETAPVGPDQPMYVNAVAEIGTDLSPRELLARLQEVESALGRDRQAEEHWGSRTCDLDIELIDDLVLDSEDLTVPHPRLHERPFVLVPLMQIAPEVMHPVLSKTVRQLVLDLESRS